MLNVAVLELPKAPIPIVVDPSLKVTDPVGAPVPAAGTTAAVNVTVAPRLAGVIEDVTVVAVAIIATVTDIEFEVDAA